MNHINSISHKNDKLVNAIRKMVAILSWPQCVKWNFKKPALFKKESSTKNSFDYKASRLANLIILYWLTIDLLQNYLWPLHTLQHFFSALLIMALTAECCRATVNVLNVPGGQCAGTFMYYIMHYLPVWIPRWSHKVFFVYKPSTVGFCHKTAKFVLNIHNRH